VSAAIAVASGFDLAALGVDLRLWCVDLEAPADENEALPTPVRERALRFVREADRRRYLASQRALRRVLGTAAPWTVGARGKPALESGRPHFNLGRRDRWAAIGLSDTHELGVDVETLRPIEDAAELAAMHFSARERAAVSQAAGPARDLAFLRVWTRKEACMKATGLGLSLAPSSFECGARAKPARVRIDRPEGAWSLLVHTPLVQLPIVLSWAVVLP
jgi:4'-phosphopantetheinyl transferase